MLRVSLILRVRAMISYHNQLHNSHTVKTHIMRRYGAPLCCNRSSMVCPSAQPRCDYPGRQPLTRVFDNPINRGGKCNQYRGDCAVGTRCYQNRCTDVIPAGGICSLKKICNSEACRARNVCKEGYHCSNQRCRARLTRPCQEGDVCDDGTRCVLNTCNVPSNPVEGLCRQSDDCKSGLCSKGRCVEGCQPGKVCDSGYTCLQGLCKLPIITAELPITPTAAAWFTSNYQYCIMDCNSTTSPHCKGTAQSWDEVYASVEECCEQSAFQGNYVGCLNRSLHYSGGVHWT